MKISNGTLWYEDEKGNIVDHDFCGPKMPAKYQWSRFPTCLYTNILALEDGKSTRIGTASASWSPDLVLAMVRPSLKEKLKSFFRYRRFRKNFNDINTAILLAAETCERCMNYMAHRTGLDWGYKKNSTDYNKAETCCDLCEDKNYDGVKNYLG